jgi:hypothetical protein
VSDESDTKFKGTSENDGEKDGLNAEDKYGGEFDLREVKTVEPCISSEKEAKSPTSIFSLISERMLEGRRREKGKRGDDGCELLFIRAFPSPKRNGNLPPRADGLSNAASSKSQRGDGCFDALERKKSLALIKKGLKRPSNEEIEDEEEEEDEVESPSRSLNEYSAKISSNESESEGRGGQ